MTNTNSWRIGVGLVIASIFFFILALSIALSYSITVGILSTVIGTLLLIVGADLIKEKNQD